MSAIIFIATINIETVGGWIAAMLATTGVIWVLLQFLVQGFWEKTAKPVVRDLIFTINLETEVVSKQHKLMQTTIEAWHNMPEQLVLRENYIKKIIENEIRRDDGLIFKDSKLKVMELETDLETRFSLLLERFDKFQEEQEQRDRDTNERNNQIIAKLSHIEGQVQSITNNNGKQGLKMKPIKILP